LIVSIRGLVDEIEQINTVKVVVSGAANQGYSPAETKPGELGGYIGDVVFAL
jgi:hypothetical protein